MSLLLELLLTFFQIGTLSIGGGYAIIPLIQEQVVTQHGWISQRVFTDIITISQMTPGPLAVNTSTFVGIQIAGIKGAIVATLGCVFSGIVISVLLYRFFQKHANSNLITKLLQGLKSASLGLIISACATILILTFTGNSTLLIPISLDYKAIVLFLISFLVIRIWKVNPILLMFLAGVVGCFLYH